MSTTINGMVSFTANYSTDTSGSLTEYRKRSLNASLPDGTVPGSVGVHFWDHQTLTNASVTYQISALPGGKSLTVVEQWYLECPTLLGSGGTGTVGPAATHGWTNGIPANVGFGPASYLLHSTPDVNAPVVTANLNDTITITVTGTLEYYLMIVGR